MVPVTVVLSVSFLYICLLFLVAFYADRQRVLGKSIVSNPTVYALSFAVYITSWAIYGSIGRAATVGLDEIALYVGTTFIAFSWWLLLRKMVRVSKEQHLVTMSDFIASRYGKSTLVGAIVTIFAIMGTLPYIAVQLKAVAYSYNLLTVGSSPASSISSIDVAFITAVIMAIFTMIFGARHLDASERHEGLVAVIALESIVKLVALLTVGIFVTYFKFDGFIDIFNRFLAEYPERSDLLIIGTEQLPYSNWLTFIFIGMIVSMLLPRQFHVMVVENSKEEHIRETMWRFPLYLFLITLFILPLALGGIILNGGDTSQADYYTILIPLQEGKPWIALVVFIGGFSAAAGMVMVSSVALSNMILNHLVMPAILKIKTEQIDISRYLIGVKHVGIIVVILMAYLYYRFLSESYAITHFGLTSMVAITQFAPAFFGGLYWEGANKKGAISGLCLGFAIWFYTLLIPLFVGSGWISETVLENGPFNLALLKPTQFLGLDSLDIWAHSLFWTLFFNIGAFVAVSLLTKATQIEQEQAVKFVHILSDSKIASPKRRISKAPTVTEFSSLMAKFIGEKHAQAAITQFMDKTPLTDFDIHDLKRFTEKRLSGSVGAAPARIIVENYLEARGSEMEDVFDLFGSVTISRDASREQLGILHDAAKIVGSGADLQTIFDHILELLQEQFKFDLCVIRMLDSGRMSLTVASQVGMSSKHLGDSERKLDETTYIGEAYLRNNVIIVNDTDLLDRSQPALLIKQEGIKSFAHVPISIEGQAVGVLSTFSTAAKGIFSDEFIKLYKNLAGQIAVAWRNAQQMEKLMEAREKKRELEIARTIQLGLLPEKTPEIKGLSLAGICIPAREIGGDYYDYLPGSGKTLDLVVADVSGHSIGAALTMGWIRTFIRDKALTESAKTASETMSAINDFFYEDLTRAELFVTMFFLKYDPDSRELFYANAGHNPPFIYRPSSNAKIKLDAEGLILGIKTGVEFEEKKTQLQEGDLLLLYTDGIIEAEDREDQFFGDNRLMQLLKTYHALPPQEIIDKILHQVRLFTGNDNFNDDVTLVIMRLEKSHSLEKTPVTDRAINQSST